MGLLSVAVAALAAASLALPSSGKYLALGLGLFAAALGSVAFRRPRLRLLGALGMTLGLVAALLGATQIVLTLLVIERLQRP